MLINRADINEKTILEIGRFTILWNIFEDIKCDCNCTYEKIKNAVNSVNNYTPFRELRKEFENRAEMSRCCISDYVRTRLYPDDVRARIHGQATNDYMPRVIEFLNSDGESVYDGALLAVWRIRNNMFHGLKSHQELNAQVELFKAMSAVLDEVIK